MLLCASDARPSGSLETQRRCDANNTTRVNMCCEMKFPSLSTVSPTGDNCITLPVHQRHTCCVSKHLPDLTSSRWSRHNPCVRKLPGIDGFPYSLGQLYEVWVGTRLLRDTSLFCVCHQWRNVSMTQSLIETVCYSEIVKIQTSDQGCIIRLSRCLHL